MDRVRCASCGEFHYLGEIEPYFDRPDAYFEIQAERARRSWNTDQLCVLWESDAAARRHFVYALLPFPIRGETQRYSWGVWVELAEPDFAFVRDHWSDPEQAKAAPLQGHLANQLPDTPGTCDLPGHVKTDWSLNCPGVLL